MTLMALGHCLMKTFLIICINIVPLHYPTTYLKSLEILPIPDFNYQAVPPPASSVEP